MKKKLTFSEDPSAAVALVSVHKAPTSDDLDSRKHRGDRDPDMQRVTDLLELHQVVKVKHVQGDDEGLKQARRDVDKVLRRLERK